MKCPVLNHVSLQIFTSEDVELPRSAVADYLEDIEPSLCARYLVFLIEERNEISPAFHDRLAELYIDMTLAAKKRSDSTCCYLFTHICVSKKKQ